VFVLLYHSFHTHTLSPSLSLSELGSQTTSTEQKALGESTYLEKKKSNPSSRTNVLTMSKAKPPTKAAAAAKGTTKGSIKNAPEKVPASVAPAPPATFSYPPLEAATFSYPPLEAATLGPLRVTAAPGPIRVPGPENVRHFSYEKEEEEEEEEQHGSEQLSGELLVSATLVPKDAADEEEQQQQQQVALARATPLTTYEAAKVFFRGQGKFCLVASLCIIAAAIALAVGITVGYKGEETGAGTTSKEGWGVNCTGECKKECDEVLRWKNCKEGKCNPAHMALNCSGYEFDMEYECDNKSSCNSLKVVCRNDCQALL